MNWFWGNSNFDIARVENVCFKGGGMKGLTFVGVDRAMSEAGLWPQIKRFIGSSAGAIFAGASACRIPFDDLEDYVLSTDFSKFKDSKWGVTESYRLYEYLGLYPGDYFYNWYGNLLQKYIQDSEITLQGVYERFGTDLTITTTDLTLRKVIYMDRRNNPDLKLKDAVRRSMSIPLVFEPIQTIEDEETHVYIDGGCTNNYPIDYFDNLYTHSAFTRTLGFDLISDYEKSSVDSIQGLLTALINTGIETIEDVRMSPEDVKRSVMINTGNVVSTDFNMSREEIRKLIDIGYEMTKIFLEKC